MPVAMYAVQQRHCLGCQCVARSARRRIHQTGAMLGKAGDHTSEVAALLGNGGQRVSLFPCPRMCRETPPQTASAVPCPRTVRDRHRGSCVDGGVGGTRSSAAGNTHSNSGMAVRGSSMLPA